jgi:hypothetical protein
MGRKSKDELPDGYRDADELMAELRQDPEYIRRMAEKAERREKQVQRINLAVQPIMDQLHQLGYIGEDIREVIHNHAPLPPDAVSVLLHAIETCTEPLCYEMYVRALAASAYPFDGRTLVDLYAKARDEGLRWSILNTIAVARPHSIDDWIAEAEQDPYRGQILRDLR